jgi:hypothetical protein
MTPYPNRSGTSGINAYEIHDTSIVVEFRHGGTYVYDYNMPGREDVEAMKRLAERGSGLATYINRNVRKRFASRR